MSQPPLACPTLCCPPTPYRVTRLRPAVSRAYPAPCRRLPLGCVLACMAISQAQGRAPGRPCPGLAVLYCNTAQPFLFKSVTIQFFCIATQAFLALKPTSVTIVLQYNCQPTQPIAIQLPTYCTPLAIQTFLLQYNFPSSQYNLGSSPKTILHQNFILFFLIHDKYFFFH